MKLLTKVKLINWHYFWNETIKVEPIVFLTGLNGSGKSTLVDAFEVVLLGDTTGRSFNKAALDKSSRTLKGYLRGELGDDLEGGFKYLRNGRFTSYIVLEFFDDIKDEHFSLGIVFDCFEDGSEEHRFFEINDVIPQNEFVENNIPMSYKDLVVYLNDNYKGKYRFFDSNRQYQENLKKRLGGLKDKYFSLLKKATSFTPITDITTFITEYVCDPQENLDLSHLQDNIVQYSKLKTESENIERRLEKLVEIQETYQNYSKLDNDFTLAKYIIEKCELETSQEKLKAFKNEVVKSQERISEIDREIEELKNTSQELEKRKVHLIQDKANNDVAKITEDLYNQKKDIEYKIQEINDQVNQVPSTILSYINPYLEEATKINKNLSTLSLDELDDNKEEEIFNLTVSSKKVIDLSDALKARLNKDVMSVTRQNLEDYRDSLRDFKNDVSHLAISLARTISDIQKKVNSIKDEEQQVRKGRKPIDSRLLFIKNRLKDELKAKFNKDIEVELFCDLIDIKDQEWANAIEGYLYNQKFNLFVAPKYYQDAYEILRQLLNEYSYYQTALVDQEKIIERDYQMEEGSLAEEIETENEGARHYTNFLIGRLYKASSIEEMREKGNAITKECDLYRAFTLSRINPRLYSQSFIGVKVNERFLEEKVKQLNIQQQNLDSYKILYNLISDANTLELISSLEIDHLIRNLSRGSELKGYQESLDFISQELKEHDTTLLQSLDKRLKDVEDDILEITQERDRLLLEKGNLIKEIESLNQEKIIHEEEMIEEKIASLNENYSDEEIRKNGEEFFSSELENKTLIEILTESKANITRLQYLSQNIFNSLLKLRRDYVHLYHLSYDTDLRDNEIYDKELVDFRDVKLPEYQEKIHDSYLKATQQFKDDFIFKLRSAIEEVEDQIDNLNLALSQSSFGRDSYRFTCKPSLVFKRYYDMLKDDIILETGEDESSFLEKYKDVMEDLFKQIVDVSSLGESNEELLNNIEKFTDYRSYLDFDLIVYNKDTKEEQRLSKMIKKKSGGETQTPFYIAVLASFAQLYHVNEEGEISNTSRIIIFDEAFSKMDRGRIKEAVKLLRKFNLQVIISCPTDKVQDITELVDETLVVIHSKNTSQVLSFKELTKK